MPAIWIVEEKDKNGKVTFLQEYTEYDDALDAFSSLKAENTDSFISIQKSTKRLLVE